MMSDYTFSLLPLPAINFGAGRFSSIPEVVAEFCRTILLVTGSHTLQHSGRLSSLLESFKQQGFTVHQLAVEGEPSPEMVNSAVSRFRGFPFDVVLSIGGGSVLDAGKAVSAMLLQELPVERFIEGLEGFTAHDGRKVPFIAVPTTSGTGSEVTNNAVISRPGAGGFKRSLRHPSFVPDVALIDPELMLTLSVEMTVASGMDACTQLIEAYTSPLASPYTDALACSGLERFSRSFPGVCTDRALDIDARGDIAYAALLSGIVLANAGLGIVHGFASSVGGRINIPHGALCATLLAEATRENIAALRLLDQSHPALYKYANAGVILSGRAPGDLHTGCERLLDTLEAWQEQFNFPRLSHYGFNPCDIDSIVQSTRCKSNAVQLDEAAMKRILSKRM